jgi:8-oxo-dGTP diphosphatase
MPQRSVAAASTEEAPVVRWIEPAQIASLMTPAFAVRVSDALTDRRPAIRAQDGRHLLRP